MKKNYFFLSLSIIIIFSCLIYSCASNKKDVFSELTESLRLDSLAPFYHGVASGDPLPTSIILWTRVTPFFKEKNIKVLWYLSTDSLMKNIQKEGFFRTNMDRDYTVKVDVNNLDSGTLYYYQFEAFGKKSIIGRTKTTSLYSDSLNFAVVSCSDYQRGFFNSIFKRLHIPDKEIVSLSDYRTRYSQYKMDPDLISAHQKHPFIVIWDDHETSNNTYSSGAQNHQPELEGDFFKRISGALKAYYEWQPIREGEKPYRSFSFGNLADLIILEERLEGRTEQAISLEDSSLFDEKRTMLGKVQLDWFLNKLNNKKSQWKIIGNQVIFSYLNYGRSDFKINLDSWDGYPQEVKQIIANMMFNMGLTRVSKFNKHNAALQCGDWKEAAKEGRDSRWYKQVTNRAERLMARLEKL